MNHTVKNFKTVLLVIASAFMLMTLSVATVSAQGAFSGSKQEACRGANLSNDSSCHTTQSTNQIESAINFIVNLLTIIVGIVAVIMIIINGLKFITSNGDSNSISSAKHGIAYALVGLVIVALAQVIVRFVLSQV
jgi:Type IV secretion system pilin